MAKNLLEKGGFKVDMQSMDWQTLVARRAKKDPPAQGGWHAFLTSWVAADILNPVMAGFLNAGCDKAMFGWPCDKEIESLRDQFARETNPAKQKADRRGGAGARDAVPDAHPRSGQWYGAAAVRKNVDGHDRGARSPCSGTSRRRERSAAGGTRALAVPLRRHAGYVARRLLATIPVMAVVATSSSSSSCG